MKILAAISIAALLAGCVASQIIEAKPVKLTGSQLSAIQAKAAYDLIDPNSAMFRNIRAKDIKREDGTQAVEFCGEVNAKNRMGGYVGFSAFKGKFVGNAPVIEFMDSGADSLGNAALICGSY